MKPHILDKKTRNIILKAQKNEITEYFIYEKLSQSIKDPHNKKILKNISEDELRHYHFWKKYTNQDVTPDTLKMWKYYIISKLLGITFGIKLMERGEENAQIIYEKVSEVIPDAKAIQKDEDEHEKELIALLDEERLKYVGSIVLGLNDALVELLGALAGFTLTLQNTSIIGVVGLITGIAASFSMAASEYLSTKSEGHHPNPVKASVYTGSAYLITVLVLIFPYFIFKNYYVCLGVTIVNAVVIIFMFTFYVSVVKDISFRKRFLEMAFISLGIAALTFVIGFFVRMFLHIDI
ncbi:MAG: VIT1/CCC1 transporter family protein [Theionarchaea archaeon]|nr:VIT1/CCC1 transporter family protein [Theionarchaea archaeon]